MSQLIKKEKDFLRLLLNTSIKQKKVLLRAIDKSQLNAIVQIVYNLMLGYHPLADKDKKQLAKHKTVIRQFISKSISLKKRKELLLKYFKYILPFINTIKSKLL